MTTVEKPNTFHPDALKRLRQVLDPQAPPELVRPKDRANRVRRIVLRWALHGTVTRADFGPDGTLSFVASSKPEDETPVDKRIPYGDGRVPIYSAQVRRPNEDADWHTEFFLCVDHGGLVTETFQIQFAPECHAALNR